MPVRARRAARLRAVFMGAALAMAALSAPSARGLSRAAQGQEGATLLLVSQPASGVGRESFIDIAPHLEGPLRDVRRYDVIVYRRDMPAVRSALDNGALAPADLTDPLTPEAEHRIARALRAQLLLTVSTQSQKDGLVSDARIERAIGTDQWATVLAERVTPRRVGPGKRLGLLESIHVLVSSLVQRVADTTAHLPALPAPRDPTPGAPAAAPPGGAAPPTTANPGGTAPPPAGVPAAHSGGAAAARPAETPSTYALLIERARRNGDMANLMVGLRRAINERPRDVRLRRDLVQAYNDAGRHTAAREEAARAVALEPKDAALHRLLGDALLQSGDTESALKEYGVAVGLNGKDAANLVALGDAYWSAARPEEALKNYLAAVQADPKSALPHRRLARLYVQQGRYADCTAEVGQAKTLLQPEDQAGFNSDHAAMLNGVESALTELLARMQVARKAFVAGSHNREETFKEYATLRGRAEALAAFLDGLPDVGFNRVQALYSQAAALVAQTAEKSQDFLESQDTSDDEQAGLLRIEANKQIGEAAKALKASLAAKQR